MTADTDGGGRTKRVTFYVTEEKRAALKREAADRDESLSNYVRRLVDRQRQLDHEEEIAADLNPEERLAEVAARAGDEIASRATESIEDVEDRVASIEERVEAMHDLHARAATYPLVNFRLLKRQSDPPEPWVSDQFAWASEKLRAPPMDQDGDVQGDTADRDDRADRDDDQVGATDVDDLL